MVHVFVFHNFFFAKINNLGEIKMEPKMIDEKKKLLAKLERKEKILAKRLDDVREIIAVLKNKKENDILPK